MKQRQQFWALWLFLQWWANVHALEQRPYHLVDPVEGRSQLRVAREGIEFLTSLEGPVAPVVVIGPYRSGKSFLLNQLLRVPCDQGFGVGHTRDTQTKGMWIWGEPLVKRLPNGQNVSILLVDTEGFESTGRSNSYDDRIFALSTLFSSLLIYNLPEAVRESDISKLSFAVELAQGFFGKNQDASSTALEPGSMLWLIQRDFLKGKGVEALIHDILAPVSNPDNDADIAALNSIRSSLAQIARNSTGFSLVQPHLQRTKLCELADSELDPAYVTQREQLRTTVLSLALPKTAGGKFATGKQLADLLADVVEGLNAKEIPNIASLISSFNQQLIHKCLDAYSADLAKLPLPADEPALIQLEAGARGSTLLLLEDRMMGRVRYVELRKELEGEMAKQFKALKDSNVVKSNEICQGLEMRCTTVLDELMASSVPSMRQFQASYSHCLAKFTSGCVGPARTSSTVRLDRAWANAQSQFAKDYNEKLHTGLLVASLCAVVIFRFLFRLQVLEGVGWASFLFLEIYPRLHLGAGSMYDAVWWQVTAQVWDVVVFLLVGFPGARVFWFAFCCIVCIWRWQYYQRQRRKGKSKRAVEDRDLDV